MESIQSDVKFDRKKDQRENVSKTDNYDMGLLPQLLDRKERA